MGNISHVKTVMHSLMDLFQQFKTKVLQDWEAVRRRIFLQWWWKDLCEHHAACGSVSKWWMLHLPPGVSASFRIWYIWLCLHIGILMFRLHE